MAVQNIDMNNLSLVNYKLKLSYIPNVEYRVQRASLPGMTLTPVAQATPFVPAWRTGNVSYDELSCTFIVGENMKDYLEIINWITKLGYPDSLEQYDYQEHDASLMILNSAKHPVINVRFTDIFPTSISGVDFDTTLQDIQYATATVNFRFTRFYYEPVV